MQHQHRVRHAGRVPHDRAGIQYPGTLLRLPATIVALVLSAAIPAQAAPSNPLWLAAVESAARAKRWSPGRMQLAIEMADDTGKVLETWDNRYQLSADADGAVRTEVVSAFHNGKDETRKEREAQAKRDANARTDSGSPMAGFVDDPFDDAVQDAVEIRQLEGTRVIAGAACIAFAFTLTKPKNTAVEGTAWLDAATGLPVEFVSSPRPLPRSAHELVTTVRYTNGFVSEVLAEGSGTLLFFKRRFSSVITLGGYYRRAAGS